TNCCPVPNVDAYTPATDSWQGVASVPVVTEDHATATGADGRIYVFGGDNGGGGVLNNTQVYDPSTNTWATIAPMPTARNGLAAARGGDGRIYAVGGDNPGSVNGSLVVLNTVEALTTPRASAAVPPCGRKACSDEVDATGLSGRERGA